MKRLTWQFIILIGVLSATSAVYAADMVTVAAASTESQVWFGNTLQAVLAACTPPIAALICALLWKLAAKVGVDVTAADKANLTTEATTALTQAVMSPSTIAMIKQLGWDHVDVHNKIVAEALNFFLQRYPDRATSIAMSANVSSPKTDSSEKDNAVIQSLLARMPDAVDKASKSVITPPAPLTELIPASMPVATLTALTPTK